MSVPSLLSKASKVLLDPYNLVPCTVSIVVVVVVDLLASIKHWSQWLTGVTSTNLIMDDGVLEDSYIDEKERMKLNSYNINKEKGIGALQNFRCPDRKTVFRIIC